MVSYLGQKHPDLDVPVEAVLVEVFLADLLGSADRTWKVLRPIDRMMEDLVGSWRFAGDNLPNGKVSDKRLYYLAVEKYQEHSKYTAHSP